MKTDSTIEKVTWHSGLGSTHDVMVIIIGNGHGDPVWDCLHFT